MSKHSHAEVRSCWLTLRVVVDRPFTVSELEAMVPFGLNIFTAFRATMDAANDSAIANYVKELEDSNLGKSSADAQAGQLWLV